MRRTQIRQDAENPDHPQTPHRKHPLAPDRHGEIVREQAATDRQQGMSPNEHRRTITQTPREALKIFCAGDVATRVEFSSDFVNWVPGVTFTNTPFLLEVRDPDPATLHPKRFTRIRANR